MKKIYPAEMVIFLKNEEEKSRLHPGENSLFQGELFFHYRSFKTLSDLPTYDLLQGNKVNMGKFISYDELRALIGQNKLRFVALLATLVYMDLTESITEFELTYNVIADMDKHNTFEEAVNEGLVFTRISQWMEDLKYISWASYKNMKSYRSSLEGINIEETGSSIIK